MSKISNLQELCDFFGVDDATRLNRSIYKGTGCGASISVKTPDGRWFHNGQDWKDVSEIQAFTIQSIVEGSDAEVNSDEFTLPVESDEIDEWIDFMENETSRLWDEANGFDYMER